MTTHFHQPLLFEMLRSFAALAKHLNLSKAVEELNSTRQTVRRHISYLEEMKHGSLFYLQDRQYQLTELGQSVLPEAQDLIARAHGWVTGTSNLVNGLQHLSHDSMEGWSLHQQQQPLGSVLRNRNSLLNKAMTAWILSGGQLEHPDMSEIRPYLLVFRRTDNKWLCVEIGEKSSYSTWFGWANARSSIGRELGGLPAGEGFGHLVNLAYLEVEATEGARLDHTFTQIPREQDGDPVPIAFERLLMASRFPDQSFAMISVVRRTYDIDIVGIETDRFKEMPKELLM